MGHLKVAVLPVTPFQQNCALVWEADSKDALIVDPGGDVPRLLAGIDQLGVRVVKILLTHGHIDHAGGAAALRDELAARVAPEAGPPIEGPDERDAFLLEGLEAQAANYGVGGVRNVQPDRWLSEGETITLGDHRFDILHCPGHTPGHIVFISHANHFAILGDVLFQGSIGRTDFPYGDHAALIAAIKSKLLPLPDDYAFLCGHGPGSTIGAERAGNPFLR
ncbi:MAG TPA: MBL fold metallo-hydrolase [Acetobacteraceae bacterium]|jgi:hydroxyacylglutathione hydrolase|nr:MBL fold metallo-hydrolase [Acetobacteraceae bacterium]